MRPWQWGASGLASAAVLAAGRWGHPASPAPLLRLRELVEQAQEELRQGGGRDGVGAVGRGAPAELPALPPVMARDFEAGGAMGDRQTQPAGEQNGRQAVLLRAKHRELPRDLSVAVIELVQGSIHQGYLRNHRVRTLRGGAGGAFDLRTEHG
jgi:hypothetical protein